MTGILYLLNVACSAGQNALGKQYAKIGGAARVFNLNKAVCGFVVFFALGLIQGFSLHLPTAALGGSYGISLCISMHTGFKALSLGPMALTSIIVSFSLLIPFFYGILFLEEYITPTGVCGIILLLLSIVLINCKKSGGISCKWAVYTLLTLLTNGICSVIQKYHQLKFPALYRNEFMVFALFCVFSLLAASCAFTQKGDNVFKVSISGLVAGGLNCAANYIVLYLSATENASVLFPIVSVANIAAAWAVGIVFFKEKLAALQTIGLIFGAVSIVLLKL